MMGKLEPNHARTYFHWSKCHLKHYANQWLGGIWCREIFQNHDLVIGKKIANKVTYFDKEGYHVSQMVHPYAIR